MSKQKTILATAYAVNPYKGSEDGMGWNFIIQIARFNNVIAVTRENNRGNIEKYMAEVPDERYKNIRFLYFDLPYWMRFWKKGGRGAMLYYWMWQRGVIPFIRRQKYSFDIVHNLNFHNDWTPSYLWKLGKPFVWGPVGHHPRIPAQYLAPYKKSYWIKDRLTWVIKKAFWKYSSALRKTALKADVVCNMNRSVKDVLSLPGMQITMPSVATEDFGYSKPVSHEKFTLISAGRLVPLKGFDLSIKAFARFMRQLPKAQRSDVELIIVGSGPEIEFYTNLCVSEGVKDLVTFVSWIERTALMQLFKSASAFLFPSHEGAGMVVAEALSFGLPVICLDNSGPGEFIDPSCGFAIPPQPYDETVKGLSIAIQTLYQQPQTHAEMCENARKHFKHHFHWDIRGEQLNDIYKKLSA
ncbi:hypothetical protein GCM10009122_08940 [Fulvivirga kasyanovii]|uniref:Glycosyltransferase family 1 protein n=1 Tax=Fulvivirga kasyanovii TaxID=396812 RepID=A0ABW9RXW4_9BACT|nr:glycosyltransferase [Fulvivirga kasyanovii]MTI29099.1 glycosyltransferase family 1 protein [Fulvivirga kasyanovii]